jgi:hypothetical protein
MGELSIGRNVGGGIGAVSVDGIVVETIIMCWAGEMYYLYGKSTFNAKVLCLQV